MGKKIGESVDSLFGQFLFLLVVGPDQGRNVVGSEIVETGFLERAIAASGVEMMPVLPFLERRQKRRRFASRLLFRGVGTER
jgi:hypothetical protein